MTAALLSLQRRFFGRGILQQLCVDRVFRNVCVPNYAAANENNLDRSLHEAKRKVRSATILFVSKARRLGKLRLLHNLNIRELEVSARCTRAN